MVPHSHFGGDEEAAGRQARLAFARRLQGDPPEKITAALDRLRTQWQQREERREEASGSGGETQAPRSPRSNAEKV